MNFLWVVRSFGVMAGAKYLWDTILLKTQRALGS